MSTSSQDHPHILFFDERLEILHAYSFDTPRDFRNKPTVLLDNLICLVDSLK